MSDYSNAMLLKTMGEIVEHRESRKQLKYSRKLLILCRIRCHFNSMINKQLFNTRCGLKVLAQRETRYRALHLKEYRNI